MPESVWFDLAKECAGQPIILETPTEILLREMMVALKQTRRELGGIRQILLAYAKRDGLEVSHDAHSG